MIRQIVRLLSLVLLVTPCSADEATSPADVTGTFSNLEFHERSGDLAGVEATIVFSFKGHYAIIKCADGVPVVVPLKVEGPRIQYELTPSHEDSLCGLGIRYGEVDGDILRLWRAGGLDSPAVLKRQSSYWNDRSRIG